MTTTAPTQSLAQLSDQIAELSAHIDAATCRLMDLILEFDRRGGWDEEGARSCVEWLGWRLGWQANTASERLRVAQALHELPILHAAFAKGRVSYSKMRAVTRTATPETDAEWLNVALNSTAAQCEKIVRKTRRVNEAENLVTENARHDQRWLHTYHDAMGMLVIDGRLPPEAGAVVEKALEAAMRDIRTEARGETPSQSDPPAQSAGAAAGDAALSEIAATAQPEEEELSEIDATASPATAGTAPPEPTTTPAQHRADALVRIAEQSLRGKPGPSRTADRYQVMVHVDAEVLANAEAEGRCELERGPSLCAETLRRLTCDGSLVTVLHDKEGGVLNVGRKTRTLSAALRRAVHERDKGCCFPGCTCRVTEGHHVEHWADGGETKLSNIISTCKHHHRLLHEDGFTVRLDTTGAPIFSRPNGTAVSPTVTPPTLRGDPAETLTHWSRDAGLIIDADTNLPEWDGEIPQYDYIAGVMADLAHARRPTNPAPS